MNSPFVQRLYFENIKSLIDSCFSIVNKNTNEHPAASTRLKPLNPQNFSQGEYFSIQQASTDNNWQMIKDWAPSNDVPAREGFVHVPILKATVPGSTLSLSFKGNAIGIAIVSGPDAGNIYYSIDGSKEKKIDLYTQWSSSLYLPWYLLLGSGLKSGTHKLKIRIASSKNVLSKGTTCEIVHFLVNK
ncbi:hypothetical protein [Arachidicoccus sp.]|uniref:hypothetical protein n=1 Tax=Arachidicoccus sp. TaxID=1872624 RepID=UPI003D1FF9EE